MLGFGWKGNVRQLKNVVESLVVMDIDDMLDMDDLSPDLLDGKTTSGSTSATGSTNSTGSAAATAQNSSADAGPLPDDASSSALIGKSLKEIERWVIEHTLTLANHNREETARILGISERNLYRKLNEYDLR